MGEKDYDLDAFCQAPPLTAGQQARIAEAQEALLVIGITKKVGDQQREAIINDTLAKFRAGALGGQGALLAWAKLVAIEDLQGVLETRIISGEAAAEE